MAILGVLTPGAQFDRFRAGDGASYRRLLYGQARRLKTSVALVNAASLDEGSTKARLLLPGIRGWRETTDAVPAILYNMLLHPGPRETRVLRDFNGRPNVVVFNETNRLKPSTVFEVLASLPETARIVPRTNTIEPSDLGTFDRGLYLVAPSGSRNDPFILDCSGDPIKCTSVHSGHTSTIARNRQAESLPARASGGPVRIAELPCLPVSINGPVDWLYYAQRGRSGEWTVAAGVATRGANAASGTCWRLDTALARVADAKQQELGQRLVATVLAVARSLSLFFPGLAHCAIVLWVGSDGIPWLKDVISLPDPDWLRRAGDTNGLRRVLDHPIIFANLLAQRGVRKQNVDFGRTNQTAKS